MSDLRLPEELLELIFSYLEISVSAKVSDQNGSGFGGDERTKLATLASISKSNKTFHRIVASRLYKTLYLPYPCENFLEIYLRTFTTCPALANYVKQVHVRGWITQRTVGDRGQSIDTGWDDEQVLQDSLSVAACAEVGDDLLMPIRRGLNEDLPDAELALLLGICPNIETLDVILPEYFANTLVFKLMALRSSAEDAHLAPSKLRWLRELRLQPSTPKALRRLKEVSRHTIRRVGLEIFRGERLDISGFWLDRDLWNDEWPGTIRAFHLRNSFLEAADLESLLELNPNMTTLDLHWSKDDRDVNLNRIGQVLRRLARNLSSLSLDWSFSPSRWGSDLAIGRLDSLRELTRLCYLKLPLMPLVWSNDRHDIEGSHGTMRSFAEILPRSLEKFVVLRESYPGVSDMEKQIESKLFDIVGRPEFSNLQAEIGGALEHTAMM